MYHKLDEWDLLKYIEGPTSEPPIIPPLRKTTTYHGFDPNDVVTSVYISGNAAEHEQAKQDAEPWIKGNKSALNKIIAAAPGNKMHLIKHAKYTKQA